MNTAGFGDANNQLIGSMFVFNENLYIGTLNEATGCEIWRTAAVGGPPFTDWQQVNTDGFGDFKNANGNLKTVFMAVFEEEIIDNDAINVVDYLMKPINSRKLVEVIDKL